MKMQKWFKVAALVLACLAVFGFAAGALAGHYTHANVTVTPANSSYLELPVTAVAATSGAEIPMAASHYRLTASGSTNGFTNTVTLAALGTNVTPTLELPNTNDNVVVILDVAAGCSNYVLLANSGNAKLQEAWLAGAYDNITLMSVGTNWVEIGRREITLSSGISGSWTNTTSSTNTITAVKGKITAKTTAP